MAPNEEPQTDDQNQADDAPLFEDIQYNPAFELLVPEISNLEPSTEHLVLPGLVAYSLYKIDKRAQFMAYGDSFGHPPTDDDEEIILNGLITTTQMKKHLFNAEEICVRYAEKHPAGEGQTGGTE